MIESYIHLFMIVLTTIVFIKQLPYALTTEKWFTVHVRHVGRLQTRFMSELDVCIYTHFAFSAPQLLVTVTRRLFQSM